MGREDDRGALGHLGFRLDEHRATLAQLLDHELVVDDLLADVDRRAVQLEGPLDGLHGTIHSRAIAARRREQQLLGHRPHWRECRRDVRTYAGPMPQRHLDRLSSTDASFLHQEGPTSHMHIGGVLIFQGPPPPFVDYLNHVRSRLHLVPRYRQKLATPPLESGRQLWVDDPDFNIEYHVRHTALPAPGSEEQLFLLTSRIASQQLDRDKPLWENWLVEGLEGDRFAVISKTHHSLVDGVSGVDLATVMFDLEPDPPAREGGSRTVAAPARAVVGRARRRGCPRDARHNRRDHDPGSVRGHPARELGPQTPGRRRGRRRDRLGRLESRPGDAAERRDRSPSPVCRRSPPAG